MADAAYPLVVRRPVYHQLDSSENRLGDELQYLHYPHSAQSDETGQSTRSDWYEEDLLEPATTSSPIFGSKTNGIRWNRFVTSCKKLEFVSWLTGRRPQPWRYGILLGFYTSLFVFVSNVALLLVGAFLRGGYSGGIGILYQGKAENVVRTSTAYHVFINVLSTILLTSSNYCMQILCAPTRAEMDHAHKRATWVDIGLLSFRNLQHIPSRRLILWSLLAFSSLPLHLL
jgi:hypothetical protein